MHARLCRGGEASRVVLIEVTAGRANGEEWPLLEMSRAGSRSAAVEREITTP